MRRLWSTWGLALLLGTVSFCGAAESAAPASIHDALVQLTAADPAVRVRAVTAVGWDDTGAFLNRLLPLTRDAAWQVRQATAFALARHRRPSGSPELVALLEDPHPAVLEAALMALGQQADANAVPALLKVLQRFPQDDHLGWAVELAVFRCSNDAALKQRVHADIMARHRQEGWGTDVCPQSREQLLAHLHHPYPFVKQHALSVVGGWKDPALIDPLIRSLEDADAAVRQQVLWCLDQYRPLQDPRVLQALTRALGDPVEIVRIWSGYGLSGFGEKGLDALRSVISTGPSLARWGAAAALGLFGDAALPVLTRALGDADPRVRETAVEAMAKTGSAGIQKIIALLKDRDTAVRKMAAKSLGKLSASGTADPVGPTLAAPAGLAAQHAAALQRLQGPILQALEQALTDPATAVRQEAVTALGRLGSPGLPGLRRALDDASDAVSQSAFYALGTMGREAAPILLPFIRDPAARKRVLAIRALGRMRELEAASAMAAGLRDPEPEVRSETAVAFGEWGRLEDLTLLARDPETSVRGAVSTIFARAQRPEALAGLTLLLQDRQSEIRRNAVIGLSGAGTSALPWLYLALEDPAVRVRREAVAVLHGRSDSGTPARLAARLNDEDGETVQRLLAALRQWEPRPLEVMLSAARSSNRLLHQRAIWVLAQWGDDRATPALLAAVRDEDPLTRAAAVQGLGRLSLLAPGEWWSEAAVDAAAPVRAQAAWVIGKFQPPNGESLLLTLVEDQDPAVRVAALRGLKRVESPRTVSAVLQRCADDQAPARELAVDLLRLNQDADVTRTLLTLTRDPEPRVRRAVMRAFAAGTRSGATAVWTKALLDEDETVRVSAITGLGHAKHASAAAGLVASLEDEKLAVRQAAIDALTGMADACQDAFNDGMARGSRSIRLGILEVLRRARDPKGSALARLALEDADPDVVNAARVTLEALEGNTPLFEPAPR